MDYQELRSTLISKGGVIEDRGKHHIFYYIEVKGETYRATKFSHSAKGQISKKLLSIISRQMRLTTKELRHFVGCTIERKHWLNLWSQREHNWGKRE